MRRKGGRGKIIEKGRKWDGEEKNEVWRKERGTRRGRKMKVKKSISQEVVLQIP